MNHSEPGLTTSYEDSQKRIFSSRFNIVGNGFPQAHMARSMHTLTQTPYTLCGAVVTSVVIHTTQLVM